MPKGTLVDVCSFWEEMTFSHVISDAAARTRSWALVQASFKGTWMFSGASMCDLAMGGGLKRPGAG